jgi:hypothetical protein
MIEQLVEAPTKKFSEIHSFAIAAMNTIFVHRTRFFRRMYRCYSTKWLVWVAQMA